MKFFGKKLIISVLFFFVFINTSYPQLDNFSFNKPRFEDLNNHPKLVGATVNAFTEDSSGNIWIGTWNGLLRYDGHNVTRYLPEREERFSIGAKKITNIIQDNHGYLWITSLKEGLILFNPVKERFYQIKNNGKIKDGLNNNDIYGIVQDHKGNIWLGTTNGLNILPNNEVRRLYDIIDSVNTGNLSKYANFISYNEKGDLTSDYIREIYQDTVNQSIFLASSYGVNKVDKQQVENNLRNLSFEKFDFVEKDSAQENFIYTFSKSKDAKKDGYWLGTKKGIVYFDENINNAPTGNKILIDSSSKGNKYFYYRHQQTSSNKHSISHNYVLTIKSFKTDQSEQLWIGTENGLNILQKNDTNTPSFYTVKTDFTDVNGLNSNFIKKLYIDNSDVLWIGTQNGVNRVNLISKSFKTYNSNPGRPNVLSNNIVTDIDTTTNGELLMSTFGGGINRITKYQKQVELEGKKGNLHKKQFYHHKITNGQNPKANFIYSLSVDKKNNVWVGTAGNGILKLNASAFKDFNQPIEDIHYLNYKKGDNSGLPDNYIMNVYEDNKSRIWVGTWNGELCKVIKGKNRKDSFKVFNKFSEKINKYPVVAIYTDHKGKLWVGTRGGGLYCSKNKVSNNSDLSFKSFRSELEDSLSISSNYINCIYEDVNGKLWIGTENGLNLMNRKKETFKHFKVNKKFRNQTVQAIQGGDGSNLWLSTNHGLTKFNTQKDFQNNIKNYSKFDGVQDNYRNNSSLKLLSGLVIFGGKKGFTVFYPDSIKNNPYYPKINITSFKLFNQKISVNEKYNNRIILNKSIRYVDSINLKHHENSFSFDISVAHYAVPDKNLIEYKLEGLNKEWITTYGNHKVANFTNLSPGEYTLRVKAANADGVWNNKEQKIHISIAPPFWKEDWAIVSYIILIGLLVYAIGYFIMLKIRYNNDIKIERMERKKVEELNQLKLQFFTNVSHEFKTPLTLILGPLESILSKSTLDKKTHQKLFSIYKNASRLLRLINQLMDFRKIESNKINLKVQKADVISYMEDIVESFNCLNDNFNIELRTNYNLQNRFVWFDYDKLEKIVYNLLSNAFKFSPSGGLVELNINDYKNDERFWKLEVKDTGGGISPDLIDDLFTRFYNSDTSSLWKQANSGIGMALTKDLVQIHHGEIYAENTDDGALFTVLLPKFREFYSEEEILTAENDQDKQIKRNLAFKINSGMSNTHNEGFDDTFEEERDYDLPIVLVVEDNDEVRLYIKEILKDKYQIIEAENGDQGLQSAIEHIPDLIISDIMMSGIDGLELCTKVKSDEKTSHIPVILLTAKNSIEHRIEGLETGADSYIPKPFYERHLLVRVQNLIELRKKLLAKQGTSFSIEPDKLSVTSRDKQLLEKAKLLIEENMANTEYNVEEFGKDLGMSRMQLYRKIKAITGLTTNEFMRTIKLKRAGQLLETQEYSVSEVTYMVGFTDLKYFRNCFKQQFGINPSQYTEGKENNPSVNQ